MISYRKSLGQSSLTADGLALEGDGGFSFEFDVSSKHDRPTALDAGLIRLMVAAYMYLFQAHGDAGEDASFAVLLFPLALIDLSVLLSIATDRCSFNRRLLEGSDVDVF